MRLFPVVCGLPLPGLNCGRARGFDGKIAGVDAELVFTGTQASGLPQFIGGPRSNAVFAPTDCILFLFACLYFKAEQADGTPFTHSGADKLGRPGIGTIVVPPCGGRYLRCDL